MLCVLILYISGSTYSLKSTSNDKFLRNFSWQFYLLSEVLEEICWNGVSEEILFIFCFDIWPGVRTPAWRLISQHTTYYTMATSSLFNTCWHTYIIGHYDPSIRIIDLVSHITYVVCVNFIHKWRDLQFKVDFERQIFWETFHGNFIYFARNLLRGNRRRNTFRILFLMSGLGLEPWLFRLISQHTIY